MTETDATALRTNDDESGSPQHHARETALRHRRRTTPKAAARNPPTASQTSFDRMAMPHMPTQGDIRRELSCEAETICAIHERLGGTIRVIRRGYQLKWILDGSEMMPMQASIEMARIRKAAVAART